MKLLDYNIEERAQGNIPGFEKLRHRLRSMWEDEDDKEVHIGQIKRVESKFKEMGYQTKGMFDVEQMQNWKAKNNQIPWESVNGDDPSGLIDEGVNVNQDQEIVQNYFMKKKSVSLRRNGRKWIFLIDS